MEHARIFADRKFVSTACLISLAVTLVQFCTPAASLPAARSARSAADGPCTDGGFPSMRNASGDWIAPCGTPETHDGTEDAVVDSNPVVTYDVVIKVISGLVQKTREFMGKYHELRTKDPIGMEALAESVCRMKEDDRIFVDLCTIRESWSQVVNLTVTDLLPKAYNGFARFYVYLLAAQDGEQNARNEKYNFAADFGKLNGDVVETLCQLYSHFPQAEHHDGSATAAEEIIGVEAVDRVCRLPINPFTGSNANRHIRDFSVVSTMVRIGQRIVDEIKLRRVEAEVVVS